MERGVRDRHVTEAIQAATIGTARGVGSVATVARVTTIRFRVIKRSVVNCHRAAADPCATALGQAPEATVCLAVLIDAATVAAIRLAGFDSRGVDVERAAFEIDRATFGNGAFTVIKVASVPACGGVCGELAIGNAHVAGRRETGDTASL